MNPKLKEKMTESFSSVLPITMIVLIISAFLVPLSVGTMAMFLTGAAMLIVGMGLFTLGADMAMVPMGEGIGREFNKMDKLWLIGGLLFVIGFVVTMAEPDLDVLAGQVAAIPNLVLIVTVALGVGIFLVIALLRIVFKISLNKLLIILYGTVFLVSLFVPKAFLALGFDSGGVTTGPITVPFILALGAGLSSMRSDNESGEDSFGFVALCSIGPILAVMIMGIIFNPQDAAYEQTVVPQVETMQDVFHQFAVQLPDTAKEILMALIPIVVFFMVFQLFTKRFGKRQLAKIGIGIGYTAVGLILFLTGVTVGFIPVGSILGRELAMASYQWLLIPLGLLIGYFIVAAEPAVHVLNKQVEEITGGQISARTMQITLSIGVAVSVALSMARVLTGLSIYWFIVPGYVIALGLSFFVPKIFTGIAFDSGGVASGPMTTTFLLPLAMGACEGVGGNVLTDAFGIVAMVAMTPLIAIQIMGVIYQFKTSKNAREAADGKDDFLVLAEDEEEEVVCAEM